MPNCASSVWPAASAPAAAANKSALYDPPTVTMTKGTVYQFEEGTLTGAGQKWHSDYSYRRAIMIGTSTP